MTASAEDRARDLRTRLESVQRRIAEATEKAGREQAPQLIVVSKFFPASDVQILHEFGMTDFGENKDQEAAAKSAELSDLNLRWHFIGQLQSNKAKSVVRYASMVHSVDRASIVNALGKAMAREIAAAEEAGEPARPDLEVLIQVDFGEEFSPDHDATPASSGAQRGGVVPQEIAALAAAISETQHLTLRGLMTVAPLGAEPGKVFDRLREELDGLNRLYPDASIMSAGMSHDLEAAIESGATHLRIGSDVLGPRPAVR
ncbi:hypothetical protein HD598_002447 [Neomicrococcus aestuarii]|uniref:Pyridoxal phosphate homeostasis protein n=1 Tax=Neomicrococcus aestuarii TaxID=556325 RepID=A0A7W8TX34_9MICC|nr:YggS family pyridoxal phosphate-dependent enzyme [Neomicrococcus aestuarii]MBB5513760.1 hypothetical protein [Neomicrococcus aestuarii]